MLVVRRQCIHTRTVLAAVVLDGRRTGIPAEEGARICIEG